jgi:hypothetical protein
MPTNRPQLLSIVAPALLAAALLATQVDAAQAPIRRLPDGKPDISGFYMADAGGANYGLEQREYEFLTPASRGHIVDPPDGKLPYLPWARAEQRDRVLPHRGYDDPTAHCFVAGVPRSTYVPAPHQILQPPGYVVILLERMSYRTIPLDGRAHLPDNIRLWQGDSVGRWEGDTLVVDTRNLNGKTWLNEYGDVVSHAQTVVERFIPVDADTTVNLLAGEFRNGRRKTILLPLVPEYIGYMNQGLAPGLLRAVEPRIEFLPGHRFKYHVDFGRLAVSEDVAALCVSRPTNPSGNVLTNNEVHRLAAIARASSVPLIIDNAYGVPFPGILFRDAAPIWDENIILTLSLSKLGLPNTRTGIVVAYPRSSARWRP